MCGRVLLVSGFEEVAAQFGLIGVTPLNFQERWNGPPSDDYPILRWNPKTRARCLDLMRWGLVPNWSKDDKISFSTFNAKAETIAAKPAFRDAWRGGRRGILALDGFYEWKKLGAKAKQPYLISRADGSMMALAVLWDSKRLEGGEVLRSFTIITTEANELLADLHDRMPVILGMEDVAKWLGEVEAEQEEIEALLRPCPADWLEAVPVDPRMSNVRNQGAEFCRSIDLSL
jgi:putative SOS response-associated peptidase YedK